jgi:hypothetical protein
VAAAGLVPAAALGHAAFRSEFERELQLLEVELKRLEAEYNMFFAGRLPRCPGISARASTR